MGIVYEAIQISLNRRVALKVLPQELATDPNAGRRFRREVEAAARLKQPNIVPIYCFAEEDGILYYAMELLEGRSLSDLIKETRYATQEGSRLSDPRADGVAPGPGITDLQRQPTVAMPHPLPLPVEADAGDEDRQQRQPMPSPRPEYVQQACRILIHAARAIDHAHRQGVIHRDVKPQNMFVTKEGQVKITDFGLARDEGDLKVTETGRTVGTPLYMSPEQIAGGNVPIDKRTDVYSLGVTLFEMLTFAVPFEGRSRDVIYRQIMFDEPPRPRRVNRSLPRDLETIILKAMEKDPAMRYQSASELADDLVRFISGEAIWARPTSLAMHVTKWIRRNRKVAVVAVAAVVLLTGTVLGLIAHQKATRRRRATALLQTAREARAGGQLKTAAARCSQALALWPGMPDVQREAGRVDEQMGRQEQARREAEQRQKAQQETLAGQSLIREAGALTASIQRAKEAVLQLRRAVERAEAPGREQELWDSEAEVDRLLKRQDQLSGEAVGHLLSAVMLDSGNAGAKAALADVYWQKLCEAAAERQSGQMDHFAGLVKAYDVTGRYAEQLRGDGSLEIRTSPPGASVSIATYTERGPLLVTENGQTLGQTPVRRFSLPMGSYLVTLRRPGYAETRYPVLIDRLEDETLSITLYTEDEVGAGFIYVPAGKYLMGFRSGTEAFGDAVREAFVDSFFIAKCELLCEEYREFINDLAQEDAQKALAHVPRYRLEAGHYWELSNGRFVRKKDVPTPAEGPAMPIHSISYYDAVAYCRWRSRKEEVTYRLPTCAEWEKASRGADGRVFPWGNRFYPTFCNVCSPRKAETIVERVGSRPYDCSPYGVMDMAGNMLEWCADTESRGTCARQHGGHFGGPPSATRCAATRLQGNANVNTQNSLRLVKQPLR